VFARIKRYLLIPLVFAFITGITPVTLFAGCRIKACDETPVDPLLLVCGAPSQKMNINVWYIFEDASVMNTLASNFRSIHPNATISPRKFPSREEYTIQLNRAMGGPQAPDVFIIRNDELSVQKGRLAPMPLRVVRRPPDASESVDEYLAKFMPAVRTDLFLQETIRAGDGNLYEYQNLYGLPWGQEGIALFVNLDHIREFNSANPSRRIEPLPSANTTMRWTGLSDLANNLIRTPANWVAPPTEARPGVINPAAVSRYGVALGYGSQGAQGNVRYGEDVFISFLMQRNLEIIGEDWRTVNFMQGQNVTQSVEALARYSGFSDTWGRAEDGWTDSISAFNEGKVTAVFGRSFEMNFVPGNIQYEVVPFPQISENPAEWKIPAYYWARVVNANSINIPGSSPTAHCAWEFVKFVASAPQMKVYSEATKIPPTRIDLSEPDAVNLGGYRYNVYTGAIPYIHSWRKPEGERADQVVGKALNAAARGEQDKQRILNTLVQDLDQLLKVNPI